ncbi:MAG: methyltransferase domain-containing protein [Treponema sp.]|nr:methyltransferase domain-containing protein [Treponema sp.]
MKKGAVLVVPAVEDGRGGGHLVRSMNLVGSFRSKGREAFLLLPENVAPALSEPGGVNGLSDIIGLIDINGTFDRSWIKTVRPGPGEWEALILDFFRTPREDFNRWARFCGEPGKYRIPLIGIDEGGPCRDSFDFLIDLLPGPKQFVLPNIAAPAFLPLPRKRRAAFPSFLPAAAPDEKRPEKQVRVLVGFGAEDAAGLAAAVLEAFLAAGAVFPVSSSIILTVIMPNGNSNTVSGQENLRIVPSIPLLREKLADYDLFITHYGLGAFEALHAGVPVLLANPSGYHEKLSRQAGFVSAGVGGGACSRLVRLLFEKKRGGRPVLNRGFLRGLSGICGGLAERYGLDKEPRGDLADFLEGGIPRLPAACPFCGEDSFRIARRPVIARFPHRTYRLCKNCGMISMSRLSPPPFEYERDYFFDLYRKQYGKTYLEDFPNLMRTAEKRVSRIAFFLNQAAAAVPSGLKSAKKNAEARAPRILDIGCAYGPFLAASRKAGFDALGLDPAADAVRYVRDELHIPAFQGSFPDKVPPALYAGGGFDAVTLWYVIEHFENPARVLEELHKLLKPGGVLAFSTPSFSGISGRKSLKQFLYNSPSDHYTIWSPGRSGAFLKKYGFLQKKTVVSGCHPERFPLFGTFLSDKKGMAYTCFMLISRIFRLGDTFEVYAVKK